MGMRMSETCWAVSKWQVINLRSCCILLVDSVEKMSSFLLLKHCVDQPKHFPNNNTNACTSAGTMASARSLLVLHHENEANKCHDCPIIPLTSRTVVRMESRTAQLVTSWPLTTEKRNWPQPVHVRSVVDKTALGQALLQLFWFYRQYDSTDAPCSYFIH